MKKMKIYGLVGVAALAAVGGTFAYYNASQTFSNPFKTTNYSTQATEKFNPTGDNNEWKPGAEVDKDVYATNTGDGEVWVRIKFDEKWLRDGNQIGKAWESVNPTFNTTDGSISGSATVPDHQIGLPTDGIIDNDEGSVVFKKYEDNWENNWFFKEDGYFYYKTSLAKGESTTKLLDSVTLCGDADMGNFLQNTFVCVLDDIETDDNGNEKVPTYGDEHNWAELPEGTTLQEYMTETYGEAAKTKYVYTYKEDKLDEKNSGYANADYELNITVEFVQADEDAEAAKALGWSWTPAENAPSIEEP